MANASPGVLMVISGPAGSGKSSVVNLLREVSQDFAYSISATTRAARGSELHGVDYFFISKEEFKEKVDSGDILEYNMYNGDLYGTPRDFVEKMIDDGKNILLEIDVNGGLQIKERYPDAVLIFAMPPSITILEKRLRGRKTNAEKDILWRLERAKSEIDFFKCYDYCIIIQEGDNKKAVDDILDIFNSEKLRTLRNLKFRDSFYTDDANTYNRNEVNV